MKALAHIALLAVAATGAWTPALAQDRQAKDGDEVGYSYDQPEDHGDAVRRCRPAADSLTVIGRAGLSHLAINLSAPERFWAVQNARHLPAVTRARCS